MSNILIIENQIRQFIRIREKLVEDGHVVYPEYRETDDPLKPGLKIANAEIYDHFMERVMICLNKSYRKYDETAFTWIENYIREKDIKLFIIDYKICGSWDSATGIVLAQQLTGMGKFPDTPVIFLSRVPRNSKELDLNILRTKNYEWVEKGYSGRSLWEDNYFDLNVKTAIARLLAPKEEVLQQKPVDEKTLYLQKIEYLLQLTFFKENFPEFFDYIKIEVMFFEVEDKNMIDALLKTEEENLREELIIKSPRFREWEKKMKARAKNKSRNNK